MMPYVDIITAKKSPKSQDFDTYEGTSVVMQRFWEGEYYLS